MCYCRVAQKRLARVTGVLVKLLPKLFVDLPQRRHWRLFAQVARFVDDERSLLLLPVSR